jgi:hypothetical protein
MSKPKKKSKPKMKIAHKRVTKPAKAKQGSPIYKDGKCYPDDKPHELMLQSISDNEPDLQQRVHDLTRLSRIRRVSRNDELDYAAFERDEYIDVDDEGITPAQFDAIQDDLKADAATSSSPAEQTEAKPKEGVEDTAEQSDEGAKEEEAQ